MDGGVSNTELMYQKVLECASNSFSEEMTHRKPVLPSLEKITDGSTKVSEMLLQYREYLEELQYPFFAGRYKELRALFGEFYRMFLDQQTQEQKFADIRMCAAYLTEQLKWDCLDNDVKRNLEHIITLSQINTKSSL